MSNQKVVAESDYNLRSYNDAEPVYRSVADGTLIVGGECPEGFIKNGTVAEWKQYFKDYDMRQIQMARDANEI